MKNKALKEYLSVDGRNFTNNKLEKDLQKIIKLAWKLGWKYSQNIKKGKTFCVTGSGSDYPKGKIIAEHVELIFNWKK